MTQSEDDDVRPSPLPMLAAFGAGCLLTLMVDLNGQLTRHGGVLFGSWSAHGTGAVAALVLLAILHRGRWPMLPAGRRAPFWAYAGGISGAVTVVLTSAAVNTPLALAGTLALGLVGQIAFSLAADACGLFGLPKRRPGPRDLAALAMIVAGSALIILFGMGAA